MGTEEEFVEQFVRDVPGFTERYSMHLDNEGQSLAHVFFALDVVPATVASYLGDPDEESDWRRTLSYLEQVFERHDLAAARVIATSFIWQLPYPGQPGAGIVRHLGPQLKAELAEQRLP